MFTFFVGQRNANKGAWAELVVNGKAYVHAAVDTYHNAQDLQGGNAAVIRLDQNDVVWVRSGGNVHVEGRIGLRITTFTGAYLYS